MKLDKVKMPESAKNVRMILASASPRRRELLLGMGARFEVWPADCDETCPEGMAPEDEVRLLSRRKCESVAALFPDALVIGSDTLVELDGKALGKPTDREDAVRMLSNLSGRVHYVRTGVSVSWQGRTLDGTDSTAVHFREMSRAQILDYVEGGEPMDKAGAYGMQGEGGRFVLRTEGEDDTVIGLSRRLLVSLIDRILQKD